MTTILLILLTSIFYLLSFCHSECNKYDETCEGEDEGLHCVDVVSRLIYADPNNGFEDSVAKSRRFSCQTEEYCLWADMWNTTCIRASVSQNFPIYFRDDYTGNCQWLSFPITLNESISCCNEDKDCHDINREMYIDEDFPKEECFESEEISASILGVVGCYATPSFFEYLQCNQSYWNMTCPPYLFTSMQTYAKCACSVLTEVDRDYSMGNTSYQYFDELTGMVMDVMTSLGNWQEYCPTWNYSCNVAGDALLEVYEILCPLYITNDTNITELYNEIYDGINAQYSAQVTIYTQYHRDVLRILMYSEEEAWDTINWLWNLEEETNGTAIEIGNGSGCTNDAGLWNLNDKYGDYIPPTTQSPTEKESEIINPFTESNIEDTMLIIGMFIILISVLCSMFCTYKRFKTKKIKQISYETRFKIPFTNNNNKKKKDMHRSSSGHVQLSSDVDEGDSITNNKVKNK